MQTSNVSTPINGNNGRIFVALELSQRSWLVTIYSPDRDRMSRHKLEGGDQLREHDLRRARTLHLRDVAHGDAAARIRLLSPEARHPTRFALGFPPREPPSPQGGGISVLVAAQAQA